MLQPVWKMSWPRICHDFVTTLGDYESTLAFRLPHCYKLQRRKLSFREHFKAHDSPQITQKVPRIPKQETNHLQNPFIRTPKDLKRNTPLRFGCLGGFDFFFARNMAIELLLSCRFSLPILGTFQYTDDRPSHISTRFSSMMVWLDLGISIKARKLFQTVRSSL